MLRWLLRLGFVGIVVAVAIWIWSQMNQDLDEDELDEEIPIEFEVPLDPDATVSLSSANMGDTGVGPGADFEPEQSVTIAILGEPVEETAPVEQEAPVTDEMADDAVAADTETATLTEENTTSPAAEESVRDLQEINGIGPVFERKLIQAGVNNIAELATTSPDMLHALDLGFGADPENWIKQAQEMTSAK